MGKQVTVSLAQVDVVWGQPDANLARAEALLAESRRRGSDIVVFPELWTTGYDLGRARQYASPRGEGTFARVAELAGRHALYVTGSMLRREGDAVYNCAPLFSPQGELLGDYDKVHLFRLMDEDQHLSAGNRTPVFDLPWGRCAIAICYDLRFPELFRKYALAGAEMIILPAEWPHPRIEHWRTLLQARAIENELFVAACNRVGKGGGAEFFGCSTVVDPWGRHQVEGTDEEALLTVSIDLETVAEARKTLTVFEDRRPEMY